MWWPGSFQTVSSVKYLSFSVDTAPQWILWKQGGPIPKGFKRWPLKHIADTTCVSRISLYCRSSGLLSSVPINVKFWVRAPNGCCILQLTLGLTKFLYANSFKLVFLGAKAKFQGWNKLPAAANSYRRTIDGSLKRLAEWPSCPDLCFSILAPRRHLVTIVHSFNL